MFGWPHFLPLFMRTHFDNQNHEKNTQKHQHYLKILRLLTAFTPCLTSFSISKNKRSRTRYRLKGRLQSQAQQCLRWQQYWHNSKEYLESCQTSKMELFAKIVNGFLPLTILAKNFMSGAWLGSEVASGIVTNILNQECFT